MSPDTSEKPMAAARRGPNGEAAARALVRVLAIGALLGAIVGDALLLSLHRLSPGWWAASAGLLVVCVVAAWCVWHGSRHEHERGRAFAIAALLVGLPVFVTVTADGMRDGCMQERTTQGRCIDIGPWL